MTKADADKKMRAAQLFAEIRNLEASGVPVVGLRHFHAELAPLHESFALRDLDSEVGTWPDLLAAITSFAWAGDFDRARDLIAQGRKRCVGRMCDELTRLQTWMDAIPLVEQYQQQFAELAVGLSLGTLTSDEQADRERRLAKILDRLPRDHVESLLRWRSAQALPAPVSAPDNLGLIQAQDTSTSSMQCASPRPDPPRSNAMTKVGDWAFSFDEEAYSDETYSTRRECVVAAWKYGRRNGHEQPTGEVFVFVGQVVDVFSVGTCYLVAADVDDIAERAEEYLYEETLCDDPSDRVDVDEDKRALLQQKMVAAILQWAREHGLDKPCYYTVGMAREIDAADSAEIETEA